MENTVKYPLAMRILHWLMALGILGMIALGFFMGDVPKEDPLRGTLYGIHKSIGVVLLLLFFVRFGVRLISTVPPLPETFSPTAQKLAHLGHWGIYAFLLAVPLSGYLMSQAGGRAVEMFGIPMPVLMEKNETLGGIFHEAHEIMPYVFLAVIISHVAMVVHHRIKKQDVLKRML